MRIRRLQVRDLRRYRELDIELAPGVTVVRGPNEAFNLAVTRCDTNRDGQITEQEARIFADTVR